MRKIVAAVLSAVALALSSNAQYLPIDVDYASAPVSYTLNTGVGYTPTIRVNLSQGGTSVYPNGWSGILRWGDNESSINGMVPVYGSSGTSYVDFVCLSNTFFKTMKNGYLAIYLTRSNGLQNIPLVRGTLNVSRSPEINIPGAMTRTIPVSWSMLTVTGDPPWVASSNIDTVARLVATNAYIAATGAIALAGSAYSFSSNSVANNSLTSNELESVRSTSTNALGVSGNAYSLAASAATNNWLTSNALAAARSTATNALGVASNAYAMAAGALSGVALSGSGNAVTGLVSGGGVVTGQLGTIAGSGGGFNTTNPAFYGAAYVLDDVDGLTPATFIVAQDVSASAKVGIQAYGQPIMGMYSGGTNVLGLRPHTSDMRRLSYYYWNSVATNFPNTDGYVLRDIDPIPMQSWTNNQNGAGNRLTNAIVDATSLTINGADVYTESVEESFNWTRPTNFLFREYSGGVNQENTYAEGVWTNGHVQYTWGFGGPQLTNKGAAICVIPYKNASNTFNSLVLHWRSYPTTPDVAYQWASSVSYQFPHLAMAGFYSAVDGRFVAGFQFRTSAAEQYIFNRFSSNGVYASDIGGAVTVSSPETYNWIQLVDNGTNILAYRSVNGMRWVSVLSTNRAEWMTNGPTHFLIGVNTSLTAGPTNGPESFKTMFYLGGQR